MLSCMGVAPPSMQSSEERHPGDPGSTPGTRSLRLDLEREARRIAEGELSRRRGVFAALSPADREGVATVALGVAMHLAADLAAEAGHDPRLRRALAGPA